MGTKGTNKTEMLKEYAVITAGIFLTALAVYFFMMPANIVLGSVTGLAIVLVNFIPLQVSAMTFILNVLCLIIGFIFVGKEFGGKTVYTSILLPFFLYVFELFFPNNPSLTGDIILDTLCCIILISIGQSPVSYTHLDVYKRQGVLYRQTILPHNFGSCLKTQRSVHLRSEQ